MTTRHYSALTFEALRRDIHRKIENYVQSIGIYARIFSRIKDASSTTKKLLQKSAEYSASGKKMQDFLGIRVTVYFEEDVEIVARLLKRKFRFDSESVDRPDHENFSPKRHNIVFRMPDGIFHQSPDDKLIDNTFEVQIRTIFSEGWHEIEHDLRYKNKKHWEKQPTQSRGLNAILASLEMCDWGITKLTDDMAYNAYHSQDLTSLVIHKFRLRLLSVEIDDSFSKHKKSKDFLKKILRAKRTALLDVFSAADGEIPVTANNILWILANTQKIIDFKDEEFPAPLMSIMKEHAQWVG